MVPLRVRSWYSLLRGTSSPASLCCRARRFGYRRLALTDRNTLAGLWPFLTACEREEISPLIGAELTDGTDRGQVVVALVKDDQGYRNLCRLITRVKAEEGLDLATDPALSAGLVLLTGDPGRLAGLHDAGIDVAADLGNRPTETGSRLRRRARELGVVAVATPDSDLGGEDERPVRDVLQAIGSGTILGRRPAPAAAPLEAPQSYRQRFGVWPEVLSATEALAERCSFTGPRFGVVMPPWHGDGSVSGAPRELRIQAYRGACRRYGDDLSEAVVERLEYELKIICQMGFASYFLVVRDIVRSPAEEAAGRRRICGRGSGAASLVAYCLGITNVCPIRYNLYFERFLNPGRSDPPDIDVDFAWDERDALLERVFTRYGSHAAMVCNHVCFQPRLAIRETARAWGLPSGEIARLTKRLPWFYRHDEDDLEEQLSGLPTLRDQDFSGPWPDIIRLANRLIGLPRYLSVHPGGVVITPQPVSDYVPVERAAKGVPIIQWEKDGAEQAGLVKIDLLGNRSLGVIRDAVTALRANGTTLVEDDWQPEDDEATRAAIGRGETMGCFYIESPAMRLLQRKAGSGDFEQVVIQSSIIRPAANEFVREYVRRLHGGTWQPLHPALEAVLDETFGLMVYQEDVSRVAVALAGFSHAEADGLRKILSKKDRRLRLLDYRRRFYDGCRRRGLDETDIDRIWAMMMSFDGYSFCKPHSASYARVSFQAAWLKTHAPAEFMAAVISNQGGYYSTFAYVSEAKRLGLQVDPPDVSLSGYHWTGRERRIRVGLQAVRDLSRETAEAIVAARRARPFSGMADFLERVRPADDEISSLIDAGAVDSLVPGANRSVLHWQAAACSGLRSAAPGRLFAPAPAAAPSPPPPGAVEQLRREYRALGFLCHCHPLSLVNGAAARGLVKIDALARCVGRTVEVAGWLLTGKMVATKAGETMEFLTFEDETGLVETTFFPQTYDRYAHLLVGQRPYRLSGLVESDYGAVSLTVDRVEPLRR
jgi:DNA polymerase-3 subunit alpha/error-prone DNA polymerase